MEVNIAFFYGLFMDADLLREKDLNPCQTRLAFVDGFGLRIGDRATLARSNQERSYGTIIQLQHSELDQLYGVDGLRDYLPESIEAFSIADNQSIPATTYLLPVEKLSGTNHAYATSLATIARKLGIPEDYVKEIEDWGNA
ncbi:MAG: hypothetical protein ACI8P9_002800 [Parasphingorhabdus sp.]|jgi:hypothetical protein